MRVILLMNSLFTGGAEFSSLSLYGWLRSRGYEIKVVVLKNVSPSYHVNQFGFAEVTVLEGKSVWGRLKELNKIIQEFKPDIVHSVLFDANVLGRLARIRIGGFKHLESLVNEMYSESRLADPQVTRLKLAGYRALDFITQLWGVDHYHANGQSVAIHYHQMLSIRKDRMTIIPRGRKVNDFLGDALNRGKIRQEFSSGNRILFVSMARHEYQKGQDILLDALSLLSKETLTNLQLVLVGREGKLTKLIQDRISKYDLEKTVLMTGHRSDVSSILAAADVFLFPSRFEGLPGALIEAEAAGLPVICSDIPNNREVADNDNALFFPLENTSKLAHAISMLATDKALRETMRAHSLNLFRARFQLESIHQQMEQLLRSLIQ